MAASKRRLITDTFQSIIHLYINIVRQLLSMYWVLFAVWIEQIMTSQREWWGRGCGGRTGLGDWWQREMKHGVHWGHVFFPDSDPGQQKSDIHLQRILSETFRTQSITADWCGQYITMKDKLQKTPHWDVYRQASGKMTLPQIRKNTHAQTLNVAD